MYKIMQKYNKKLLAIVMVFLMIAFIIPQVSLPDRTVLYENVKDGETGDNVREAVREFMLINASFDQSLSMIKVSQPLLATRMAKELQEIKLQLVEFDDKNYNDKVAAPTP